MDIATLIGVLAGFICIVGAIMTGGGGGLALFFNIPSIMITIGGMLSATLIHFSMGQFLSIFSVVKKTMFYKMPSDNELIQNMVNYAAINRRDGALALEQHKAALDDPFQIKGLQMIIDGLDEDAIARQLSTEIEYLQERHQNGKKILEFMGASAPAFGMIGTLIGLVLMLSNLSSPDQIGGGMAAALLTTFYGALLANLLFIPLAGKLGIHSGRERRLREMVVEGLQAISRGEIPTEVREKMQAFLSDKHREELKPNV